MRVTIVGSRNFPKDSIGLLWNVIQQLPADSVVVSGGAAGIDQQAEMWAKARGLQTEIYLPDWLLGVGAGMMRNSILIERAERVIAFYDGSSKGTADSIRKAKKAKKPLEVWYADGNVERFNQFVTEFK